MKQVLLFLAVFISWSISAQITVTNASFPEEGDSLRVLNDILAQGIQISPPGPNQTWNYTDLNGTLLNESVFLPANIGANFNAYPEADLLVSLLGTAENYFKVEDSYFADLGFTGENEQTDLFNVIGIYSEPYILRRAPLNYEDENTLSTSLIFPVAAADLPDSLLENIPASDFIDSLRIRITIDQISIVDAWGNISIPGADYEVLREERFEIRETFIDAKSSIVPVWVNISSQIDNILPGLVGVDTAYSYYFLSEVKKEPILVINADVDKNPVNAVYKYEGIITNTSELKTKELDFRAYPNPAIDKIKIKTENLPSGYYTLRIYNVIGKDQYKNVHYFDSQTNEASLNIGFLSKGTYFYSLSDEFGKSIKTKRLIVTRP